MKYIDLHIHSEYTAGNGITKIPELVLRAKALGMESIALTDSASIKGFSEFRLECEKNGITPIYGCGFYMARLGLDNSLTQHLVLLAKNSQGYKNLIALNDFSYSKGLGVKPRVDFLRLKEYSKGLIALTGGLGGIYDKPYLLGDVDLADKSLNRLRAIYGNELYLELQDNGLENNRVMIKVLTELSEKEGIKTVVTGGSFYLNPSDHKECNLVREKNDNNLLKSDGYYFKTPNEIEKLFKNHKEAIERSFHIFKSLEEYRPN